MSMHLNAVPEALASGHPGIWVSDPPAAQADCSFASLFDLARLQFSSFQVEICDACNTVNLGSAHHCKGCAHKLPAYYAACEEDPKLPRLEESSLPLQRRWRLASRASFNDFAAFALLINLVVMAAEFLPFQ